MRKYCIYYRTINENEFSSSKRSTCRKCHRTQQLERYRRYKEMAVHYKGGKCEICGYNKCLASLDFHHKDPKQKDPDWRRMKYRAFCDAIKEELDKCMLVCKNCHMEIHYNYNLSES